MIIGIVGSNQSKFTSITEEKARNVIRRLIDRAGCMGSICSGECHEGGVDIYAHEEADKAGINFIAFPPGELRWGGSNGFMARNIQIAQTSDLVVCIAPRNLPPGYNGMRFAHCYHHEDQERAGLEVPKHVKGGGCWTLKYARSLGKPTELMVIEDE